MVVEYVLHAFAITEESHIRVCWWRWMLPWWVAVPAAGQGSWKEHVVGRTAITRRTKNKQRCAGRVGGPLQPLGQQSLHQAGYFLAGKTVVGRWAFGHGGVDPQTPPRPPFPLLAVLGLQRCYFAPTGRRGLPRGSGRIDSILHQPTLAFSSGGLAVRTPAEATSKSKRASLRRLPVGRGGCGSRT
jgi:hypothetical protein